jgi:hypothetical protein
VGNRPGLEQATSRQKLTEDHFNISAKRNPRSTIADGVAYSCSMFNWRKRDAPPGTCEANPGKHIKVTAAFTNGTRTWEEVADVLACMSEVLKTGSQSHTSGNSWIELEDGFVVQPRLLSFKPLPDEGVQTVTTVEVSNPAGIPEGVFEF